VSNGSQIGGVIGAAVGFYFGGPQGAQIGYTVGSVVGGYIDPAEIFGPQLRDAAAQTAMDGVPRAYGYGTFPCAGNLIWCSDLTMRTKTESSKGAPTETVTYHYYRSYAIAVCQAPDHGNGIAGFRIVKRNGKVVYDTRTDAELTSLGYSPTEIAETRAAQTKFLQKATFYYGIADQPPDPTIQAVKGADNVPGYSYTAYMVVRNEDLTELRGAVPQYEFVVSVCGERTESQGSGQIVISCTGGTAKFITARAKEVPEFTVISPSTGADLDQAALGVSDDGIWLAVGDDGTMRYSTDIEEEWHTVSAGRTQRGRFAVCGHDGWIIQHNNSLARASRIPIDAVPYSLDLSTGLQSSANMNVYQDGRYISSNRFNSYQMFVSTIDLDDQWTRTLTQDGDDGRRLPDGGYIRMFSDMIQVGESIYACCRVMGGGGGTVDFGYDIRRSDDAGLTWPTRLHRTINTTNSTAAQLAYGNGIVLSVSRNASVCYTSADGFAEGHPTGVSFQSVPDEWSLDTTRRYIVFVGEWFFIIGRFGVVTTRDGLTFSDVTPWPAGISEGWAIAGLSDFDAGTPIPDAPGYYIDPVTGEIIGPGGTTISECAPTLTEIVEDQCALRSVTTVDASDLEDDYVLGFRIANTSSPQKNIQAAMPGYFFDASEFDGVEHFVKRGGEDSFHIPYAEMCARDGDTIQWERTQEAELLRKVTFTYFDPRATYTPTSQTGERRAGTIQAMGESASQLPIVGTGAWAAQAAEINLKAAWSESDECTFPVSLDWAELVTAAVGTIEDERGTIHRVRIADIKDDGLKRMVTARRTDSAAYQSNAGGKPIPLPTFPGSDIRGPVFGAIMNSPVIVDADDRPGIYWAAGGMTSGYLGASLQLLRSGQWVELGQLLGSSVVGTLTQPLPQHGGDIDTQHVMTVSMRSELSSTTFQNLLGERNAMAIVRPDNSIEIVQFQSATPIDTNVFELSTLIRNRLNTYGSSHEAGATVVLLDSGVSFVDLRPEEIGQVLTFRMVSLGTSPDAAPALLVDMSTMHSQTEWPVADLRVVKDGDDYTMTWLARHRLGSDVFPLRSTNWDGYLVSWQFGDQLHEEVVTTESITFTIPGASDIEFSVAQINRFTGPGPETTVHIP
jgi:hypothetical protein